MKNLIQNNFIFILLLSILIISCKKEEEVSKEGENKPSIIISSANFNGSGISSESQVEAGSSVIFNLKVSTPKSFESLVITSNGDKIQEYNKSEVSSKTSNNIAFSFVADEKYIAKKQVLLAFVVTDVAKQESKVTFKFNVVKTVYKKPVTKITSVKYNGKDLPARGGVKVNSAIDFNLTMETEGTFKTLSILANGTQIHQADKSKNPNRKNNNYTYQFEAGEKYANKNVTLAFVTQDSLSQTDTARFEFQVKPYKKPVIKIASVKYNGKDLPTKGVVEENSTIDFKLIIETEETFNALSILANGNQIRRVGKSELLNKKNNNYTYQFKADKKYRDKNVTLAFVIQDSLNQKSTVKFELRVEYTKARKITGLKVYPPIIDGTSKSFFSISEGKLYSPKDVSGTPQPVSDLIDLGYIMAILRRLH